MSAREWLIEVDPAFPDFPRWVAYPALLALVMAFPDDRPLHFRARPAGRLWQWIASTE